MATFSCTFYSHNCTNVVNFQKNEEENDIDGSTLVNEKENNSSNHNECVDSVKSNKSKKKSVRNNRLAGLRRRRVNGDAATASDGQYQLTLVYQKQEMVSLPRKQTCLPPAIQRHSFHSILYLQESLHYLFYIPITELSVLLQNKTF